MLFDLVQAPFSRYGSYMGISYMPEKDERPEGLYLRSIHGRSNLREMARIEPVDGSEMKIDYDPSMLTLRYSGECKIIFSSANTIRLKGKGTGLKLCDNFTVFQPHKSLIKFSDTRIVVSLAVQYFQLGINMLQGQLIVDHDWNGGGVPNLTISFAGDENGDWECEFEDYPTPYFPLPERYESFEVEHERVKAEFEAFYAAMPQVPAEYEHLRHFAGYVNWSSVVGVLNNMTRPGMYMSKNYMCNVWSWDNCFNAMALTGGLPELAWDQFIQMFDHQDQYGAIPDTINDGGEVHLGTKPPVHGWTLGKMMERMILTTAQKEEAYDRLTKWTNWWMYYRAGANGLPYYYHGNDSGWDNSTCFLPLVPISTPDLPSYLVIQMRVLARLAKDLGMGAESREWNLRADELKQKIVEHYWDGEKLAALDIEGNKHYSDSLLPRMSIMLGDELPAEIRDYVISGLLTPAEEGGYLTEWGVMTEKLNSPYYVSDGYWRGPIWAPSTLIIVDGLYRAGYKEEAKELSIRFAKLCDRGTFAENFDAVSGEGLRDRAYTWTASSFLVMMRDYL